MTSDRRPAGAVLLTLCVTGLGHLYAGRPRAALAFAVAGHLYGVALVFLILSRPSAPAFLCAVVIGLGLALTAIVHAGIVAKRAIRPYELRWYNRWWIYVLVLLFAWFVWQPGLKSLINRSVSAFRNPSPAMEPTILPGDHLFADVRPAARRMPERNDVVIFRSIDQPGLTVMKRVVGIPGDTLETRDGQLFRNGHRVAEPWIVPLSSSDATPLVRGKTPSVPSSTGQPTMLNWGPIVVPAGRLFVMGDNRPDSYDSRVWGTLPAENIVGRPLSLYFSFDRPAWRVRWDRIGTSPWVVPCAAESRDSAICR